MEKVCKKCQETLSLDNFPEARNVCRSCRTKARYNTISYKDSVKSSSLKRAAELEKILTKNAEEEHQHILENDSLSEEVWKYIPNFNNKYQASNLGRIRCMPITYRSKNKGVLQKTDYYLVSSQKDKDGYLRSTLTNLEGKASTKGVHRWVVFAFLGESNLQVDHINGIRDDNNLNNLRYATSRENSNYRKDVRPDDFSSDLYGTQKSGDRWSSCITINGADYYLGSYKTEIEAHRVYMESWDNWERLGKLPSVWLNPDKTSNYRYIDFHKSSQKWRVRTSGGDYIGLFTSEAQANRVSTLVEYLIFKGVIINESLVRRIKIKYQRGSTNKKPLVNTETGEQYSSLSKAAVALGVNRTTISKQLLGNRVKTLPLKYL